VVVEPVVAVVILEGDARGVVVVVEHEVMGEGGRGKAEVVLKSAKATSIGVVADPLAEPGARRAGGGLVGGG
jgi:hypothetical protein